MIWKKTICRWLTVLALLALSGCGAASGTASREVTGPTPTPPLYWVEVQGRTRYAYDRTVTVEAGFEPEELLAELAAMPALERVVVTGGAVDRETQDALRAARGDILFACDTELLGRVWPWATRTMDLGDADLTEQELGELRDNLFRLPNVKTVVFRGGTDGAALHALSQALEGIDVVWPISVYGQEFSSADTEIDLSGMKIADSGAALEERLDWFPHLEKVVMCDCGVDNETMDALNRKYEQIRFVWSVHFSIWTVRTDATNFICNRTYNHAPLYSWHCEALRYCTDLIALDVGHKSIEDLSFLYGLPQLQYLILAENPVRDLTPIGSLRELKYLEIFWTRTEDLSPLAECTALRDLNISYVYAKGNNAYDALSRMPWLERLWCCGSNMSGEQIEALRAAMPECEIYAERYGESTGGTWRYHPHYYEMRDVFEMYYMNSGEDSSAQPNSKLPGLVG